MKKLLYILSLIILAACESAPLQVEPVIPSTGDALVGFTLTLDAGNVPSRAISRTPGDGPYDPGAGYENQIGIPEGDFRFLFYTADDKFLGTVKVQAIIPLTPSFDNRRYQVRGYVSGAVARGVKQGFKLAVLANWGAYPEPEADSDLSVLWEAQEAIMDFSSFNGRIDEEHLIPLYGIRQYPPMELSADLLTEIGEVNLLRAFAKVDVTLDHTVFPVQSVTFSRVSSSLLKAPRDVRSQSDYVHNSYPLDYLQEPSVPVTTMTADVPFELISGTDNATRVYRIYVPEYLNTEANRTQIDITYVDPSIPTSHIELRNNAVGGSSNLAPGAYFNILRNNWYRFNCTMKSIADIHVIVDVQPYAEVILSPLFGLERDEEGNIIVRNDNGDIIKMIYVDGKVLNYSVMDLLGIGETLGVFDEDRVLILDLPGNMIRYYNYDYVDAKGLDPKELTCISWENYVTNRYNELLYLEEEFEFWILNRVNSVWENRNIHNFYCASGHGHLIEQYTGGTRDDYNNKVPGVIRTVRCEEDTPDKGWITIYYTRPTDGKDYRKIVIDPDDNETYYDL